MGWSEQRRKRIVEFMVEIKIPQTPTNQEEVMRNEML